MSGSEFGGATDSRSPASLDDEVEREEAERRAVREEVLDDIVRRIVDVAQPEKIILFGSAARGEGGPNSDLDLLVIKRGAHRRRLAQEIYMNLYGVGQAVDVVVVTPEDVEQYQDAIGLVVEPALREGRTIYVA